MGLLPGPGATCNPCFCMACGVSGDLLLRWVRCGDLQPPPGVDRKERVDPALPGAALYRIRPRCGSVCILYRERIYVAPSRWHSWHVYDRPLAPGPGRHYAPLAAYLPSDQ